MQLGRRDAAWPEQKTGAFSELHKHVKVNVWEPASEYDLAGAEGEVHPVHSLVRLKLDVNVSQRSGLTERHSLTSRSQLQSNERPDAFGKLLVFFFVLAKTYVAGKELPQQWAHIQEQHVYDVVRRRRRGLFFRSRKGGGRKHVAQDLGRRITSSP